MKKSIKYILSLTPVVFLILFLAIVIRIYGIDALSGPSQLVLITSTGIAVLVAMLYFHQPWKTLEEEINHSIGSIGSPICILLLIGLLSGTWMVSGVVPMLIYYGMQIISPHVFLVSACAISAIVSVMTGSSWTTVATIGVALMGIGKAEGFSDGWTAGAILSGAYFGDKMSPLSDTTVLASSLCHVPLFSHIKYMTITGALVHHLPRHLPCRRLLRSCNSKHRHDCIYKCFGIEVQLEFVAFVGPPLHGLDDL